MVVTVVVLAGGLGSRLGGDKALVSLAGSPLISYPLRAAANGGLTAVVVAKRSTRLPLLEVPLLLEPDAPSHPLLGVVTALTSFQAVLAIPCDMPFIAPSSLLALARVEADAATLWPGEPFPCLYRRGALPALRAALAAGASVRSTQSGCEAALASGAEAESLTVNTPADLARAERRLSRR